MKKCPYCAEEIQDEAVVCRYCQRDLAPAQQMAPETNQQPVRAQLKPIQKKSGCGTLLLILLAGFVLIIIITALSSPNSPAPRRQSTASPASPKAPSPASAPAKPASAWRYSEFDDSMGRGKIKSASVASNNTVNFDFPYQGSQNAELTLRNHPKWGKDVILTIKKGQFMCSSFQDCKVTVRFDDGKPVTYSAIGPEDNSTTTIFIRNYSRFVTNLKKSKKCYIEAQFFQQGNRVFEFNVSEYKW